MSSVVKRDHAALGASSADRWMHCAASNRLSEGQPNPETEHSKAGTAAHAVLEKCLKGNVPPDTYLDVVVEGVTVDEEMVEAVRVMVDYVHHLTQAPGSVLWVERRFSLAELRPPADMFGTADVVVFQPETRTLHVPDFKYGQGYAVAARGNPQLRYYGLGALLDIEREIGPGRIDRIELTICQPRAIHPDGILRSDFLTYSELADFADTLLDAARATLDPAAQPTIGPWCRWCRAQAICPAQRQHAMALAQVDFAENVAPPAPQSLRLELLLEIHQKRGIIESWLKAVSETIEGKLRAGEEVPGYKLVAKRAMRKWIPNEGFVRERLVSSGLSATDFESHELKSPAQVEKLLGKKDFEAQMADCVTKESSGEVLAPLADPRPAVLAGPANEFTSLPAGTDPRSIG